MASVHKDPRGKSPFWYCAYRLPSGKRVFRSTKLTERKAAEEFCRRLEYASNESKSGRLTETRARELIGEIVEQTTGEPFRNYTAHDWLTEWLQGKKATKATGTFLKYENAINGFTTSLGNRAKLNVNQILARDVHRYRDAEIDSGKAPGTTNDNVKVVRMAFRSAWRQGYITHNPAEAVEMLPEDGEATRQPFDLAQIKALLRAATGDWTGVIMVAFYTSARLQDAANLRWENIDLARRLISFRAGKTRQRVTLPMHEALHDYLLTLPASDSAKAFLFPSLAGKQVGGKSGLSMAFSRLMEHAKVRGEVVRERKGEKGRSVRTLSFHSLRHSFASILANEGVNEEVRMKLGGWSDRDVHAGYTHHELEILRGAIDKLPSIST
ncbi:MAG TPA: tyrosine-type recombinase/integrase [Candidatus Udaeobacter sp.]|jgi:integrase|nr:tyrosine-type recombinase/integrase [Candidatus Udaeobacter sp.]